LARDEADLLHRCLAGDQDACTELVDDHARMVGTIIWRATGDHEAVEDLAQETFLRVFRGLPYFEARAKLSTWICTVAHRVAIDHQRSAGRRRENQLTADEGPDALPLDRLPASRGLDPEEAAGRAQTDRIVREGLRQLPEKYRLPLVYAAIDGLDYGTIASMLDVPLGTVKTHVFRAKQMLKERIAPALQARGVRREAPDAQ
jgi:RNA polymerase sigma-70 factor (ECF subfamily)